VGYTMVNANRHWVRTGGCACATPSPGNHRLLPAGWRGASLSTAYAINVSVEAAERDGGRGFPAFHHVLLKAVTTLIADRR